ncbi:MAG: hypothetical protein KAT68_18670 [Bacteroidales bacterium]|nr:hypothetical protein [Bacteroidales bacterium]
MGIKASYYFRITPKSFKLKILQKIVNLGHELGYHYEDLSKTKGDYEKAFKLFINNLETFRQFYPVKTMCMHGSVYSKYDNRWLWRKFNYKNYGIICEPYLDLNFDEILYLTDTSRMWDGNKFSIRDKVESTYNFKLHSTYDIIDAIDEEILPAKILINTHPARWYDRLLPWAKEFIVQNTKNIIKWIVVKIK